MIEKNFDVFSILARDATLDNTNIYIEKTEEAIKKIRNGLEKEKTR